jgi:hypothetical protein
VAGSFGQVLNLYIALIFNDREISLFGLNGGSYEHTNAPEKSNENREETSEYLIHSTP